MFSDNWASGSIQGSEGATWALGAGNYPGYPHEALVL